jgi:hypothetical protein
MEGNYLQIQLYARDQSPGLQPPQPKLPFELPYMLRKLRII